MTDSTIYRDYREWIRCGECVYHLTGLLRPSYCYVTVDLKKPSDGCRDGKKEQQKPWWLRGED